MRALIFLAAMLLAAPASAQQANWLWFGTNNNTAVPVSAANPLPVTGAGNVQCTTLTANTLIKATGATACANSSVTDNGSLVSTGEPIASKTSGSFFNESANSGQGNVVEIQQGGNLNHFLTGLAASTGASAAATVVLGGEDGGTYAGLLGIAYNHSVYTPVAIWTGAAATGATTGMAALFDISQNTTLFKGVNFPGIANAAGNEILCYDTTNGPVTYETAVAGCVPSALRFKTPIGRITDATAIDALRPAVWTYKDEAKWGTRPYVGLYADDVAKMDPRCVDYDKSGKLENYEDRCVIAYLVATVQAQGSEIATLKAAVNRP